MDGGRARITIPAGTQTGQQFRLTGKGLPVLRSASRGAMFVHAVVETPANLTRHQKELQREFEKDGGNEQHSPESAGFFSKVKEIWEDLRE